MNVMQPRKPQVLAIDLEGTLISNAVSQIPRPGLYEFLSLCRNLFPRLVIFTAVEELRFRYIANLLVTDQFAPQWFATIEYINWDGTTKDLNFILGVKPQDVLLVDDFEEYIHPEQEFQWVPISCFEYPYSATDAELSRVFEELKRHIHSQQKTAQENLSIQNIGVTFLVAP